MSDVVNRLARELAEAIAASVASDPRVEACREKGRAAGYEMQVALEAIIGFASRDPRSAPSSTDTNPPSAVPDRRAAMSANDRRFLRSLRIAVDDVGERAEEVE